MKKSKAETAETRKRIVDIASREFKEKGIQSASVSEIMSAAGLTHGGFYRHFKSKEDLLTEACSAALGRMAENAQAAVDGGNEAFVRYLDNYLSTNMREDFAASCVFVTMGSELARADDETRHVMTEGFKTWIDILAKQTPDKPADDARADAMFRLSAMVGALTMARIADDKDFAEQILGEIRTRLIAPAP